ncbi:non-homologous end-joining DNA ligase [Kribbella jiaozuonensis]|uniref:ATP-dependent DNA ligase n=1 Tax=Kribbella jiaozuonensis TaxID=2575441 RepID=A0A4U3M321_9ACTN|nr:non-homologous end-joining DNA ligase [Kribbella jiaozuonensis]TKK82740.1 ATP-dependent DNA ligase [Kribbella jiaozuonensis]
MTDEVRVGRRTIQLSRTDKVLFPDDGVTKGDLISYYETVAPRMVPYLKGRPLSLERFPDGIDGQQVFQQTVPRYFPDWIETASVKRLGGAGNVKHAVVSSAAALVYLANQACITPHTWLSRADRPRKPDQLIFDLDPSGDDFPAARRAALDVRELLTDLGLPSLLKTTGGKGLHVHVLLDRTADFDQVREFASGVAQVLVARDPKRYTIEQRIAKREGRLYLDIMRNAYGQTAVPPYAVRARAGAPVATPLDWSELDDRRMRGDRFTIRSVVRRFERDGDPWRGSSRRRSLTRPWRRLNDLLTEK